MTQEHPITPPEELVREWLNTWDKAKVKHVTEYEFIATQAARWGADQELEACCADLRMVLGPNQADWLRSVRRPKPPSLKEQALNALDEERAEMSIVNYKTIRAVLESLPS